MVIYTVAMVILYTVAMVTVLLWLPNDLETEWLLNGWNYHLVERRGGWGGGRRGSRRDTGRERDRERKRGREGGREGER